MRLVLVDDRELRRHCRVVLEECHQAVLLGRPILPHLLLGCRVFLLPGLLLIRSAMCFVSFPLLGAVLLPPFTALHDRREPGLFIGFPSLLRALDSVCIDGIFVRDSREYVSSLFDNSKLARVKSGTWEALLFTHESF